MYKNNFVVAVKSKDNVLREIDDKIYMPFGSNYTIYLKNLDSRRASVSVEIDGEDVLDGNKLIINSHDDMELEGFLSGNKAEYGFKFIERNKAVEQYRGIQAEDGIIRVEVKFEKPKPTYNINYRPDTSVWPYHYYPITYWWSFRNPLTTADRVYGCDYSVGNVTHSKTVMNDAGITVKGDDVDQNFHYSSFGEYDSDTVVICLKLLGTKEEPIFVKTKLVCSSCGKSCSSNQKYCPECGTRLL